MSHEAVYGDLRALVGWPLSPSRLDRVPHLAPLAVTPSVTDIKAILLEGIRSIRSNQGPLPLSKLRDSTPEGLAAALQAIYCLQEDLDLSGESARDRRRRAVDVLRLNIAVDTWRRDFEGELVR